jgi:hypothetical protein
MQIKHCAKSTFETHSRAKRWKILGAVGQGAEDGKASTDLFGTYMKINVVLLIPEDARSHFFPNTMALWELQMYHLDTD